MTSVKNWSRRRGGPVRRWSGPLRKGRFGADFGEFDRISDLRADYEACTEAKLRVTLSTELRLLETAVARLLKQIKTRYAAPDSKKTVRARRAANARWEHENAAG